METGDCDFHWESYRRVPMNSATTQKDSTESYSLGTYSTNSVWSRSNKSSLRTTYIDGSKMLGQQDSPANIKDSFPKGKSRQKSTHSSEKKDARDAYMSLLPPNGPSAIRSSSSTASVLPEVSCKSANIRNKRLLCATVFDDNSQPKFYACYTTTQTDSAWIRRYKSINESQMLNDIFREQPYQEKALLKKRPYQQINSSSSSSTTTSISSFTSSFNKRRREKC